MKYLKKVSDFIKGKKNKKELLPKDDQITKCNIFDTNTFEFKDWYLKWKTDPNFVSYKRTVTLNHTSINRLMFHSIDFKIFAKDLFEIIGRLDIRLEKFNIESWDISVESGKGKKQDVTSVAYLITLVEIEKLEDLEIPYDIYDYYIDQIEKGLEIKRKQYLENYNVDRFSTFYKIDYADGRSEIGKRERKNGKINIAVFTSLGV